MDYEKLSRFSDLYLVDVALYGEAGFAFPRWKSDSLSFLEANLEIQDILSHFPSHVFPRFLRFNKQYVFAIVYIKEQEIFIGPFLMKEDVYFANDYQDIKIKEQQTEPRSFHYETIVAIIAGFATNMVEKVIHEDGIIEKNFTDAKMEATLDALTVQKAYTELEQNRPHHSFAIVANLERALENGEARLVHDAINELINQIGKTNVFGSELRSAKNMAISGITIGTRTAIKCNVPYELAYSLSDTYIKNIEEAPTSKEVCDGIILFMMKIAKLIREGKESKKRKKAIDNPHVAKAVDYITAHLTETMTVESIAKDTGLTPNYLSSTFKKVVGQTISKFIQEQKIMLSKKLLLDAGLTESEVAANLSFSSQGHFCKVFKEQVGMTPREYIKRAIVQRQE